ncbi:MAG: UDP binding domain-containing protein, partial [Gaiellales bacterium]
ALKLIELLSESGAVISYHDPHVPSLADEGFDLTSTELTGEALAGADVVCVVTAHSGIDYARVADSAQLVVDFRNAVPARDGRVVAL